MSEGAEPQIVLTPVQARQGFLGKPVLLVLVVSLLMIVGFLTLYATLGQ